jgi:steroid 5-alpha reductase family enzyme
MGFPTDAFVHTLAWTGGTVGALIAVTFVAGLILGRHNIVDSTWGLLFVGIGIAALVTSQGHGDPVRRWMLAVMVGIWGIRLAVHVGRRSRGKGEDPRYEKLLERGSANPTVNAIGKIYLPQAILAFVISAPVQVGAFERGGVGVIAIIGVLVWAVGVLFETVGDAQMERYKRWKKSQPPDDVKWSVMDKGLWRYTRHPNYFGDACVWWGLFLVAAEHWPGVLTLPSVAIMTYLLTQGSGKKNLERSMVKRPGYPEYMHRTSGFVPWPPRKPELSLDGGDNGSTRQERSRHDRV